VLGSFWKAYLVRPPACFILASFGHFFLVILGRLIWLSKKTNKDRRKGTVQNQKKRKVKEVQSIWCAPYLHPTSLFLASRTSIFGAP